MSNAVAPQQKRKMFYEEDHDQIVHSRCPPQNGSPRQVSWAEGKKAMVADQFKLAPVHHPAARFYLMAF